MAYSLKMAPGSLEFLHGTYFLLVAPSSDCPELFSPLAVLIWFLKKLKLMLSTFCLALLPCLHTSTPNVICFS